MFALIDVISYALASIVCNARTNAFALAVTVPLTVLIVEAGSVIGAFDADTAVVAFTTTGTDRTMPDAKPFCTITTS